MLYSEKLRQLADYLDDKPELLNEMNGEWDYPSVYIIAEDYDRFQELIRDLDGFEKSGYSGNLYATHELRHVFSVQVAVSGVCEATPKLDDDGNPVMRHIEARVQEAEDVPVMEYKCPDSWLSK